MNHPVMDVPAPQTVASMSMTDLHDVLTCCPESRNFMHNNLNLSFEQARALAFELALRWHQRQALSRRDQLLIHPDHRMYPIHEANEEAKEDMPPEFPNTIRNVESI